MHEENFSPVFKAQGEIYHRVGSHLPMSNELQNFFKYTSLTIKNLKQDTNFERTMNEAEKAAWVSLKNVSQNFLGNNKSEDYSILVDELLENYKYLGCLMNLKLHFLDSHLNHFPENCGDYSEEQGERFHQDISKMENRIKTKASNCYKDIRGTDGGPPLYKTFCGEKGVGDLGRGKTLIHSSDDRELIEPLERPLIVKKRRTYMPASYVLAQSNQEVVPMVSEFEPQPCTSAAAFAMDAAEPASQPASPVVSVPSPAAFIEWEGHGNITTPSSIASPSFLFLMSRPLNDDKIPELLFNEINDDDNNEEVETWVPMMLPPFMRLQAEEQMLEEAESSSPQPPHISVDVGAKPSIRSESQARVMSMVSGPMRPSSRMAKWKDTTVNEMYVFLEIVLTMGTLVKARIEDYWSTSKNIFSTPAPGGDIQTKTPLRRLVKEPLKPFDDLLGKNGVLLTHQRNKYHELAVEAGKNFLLSFHKPEINIMNQVNSQRLKQINENRERLRPIVKTIIFCGHQNISLRGHRDDGKLLNYDSVVADEGNFRALLKFRIDSGDIALQQHLESSKSNATYISKTVQNELIEVCAEIIQENILQNVREAKYFSILFDEITDISHTSQLSLSFRYLHDGIIKEHFVTFCDTYNALRREDYNSGDIEPRLTGVALAKIVENLCTKFNLDLSWCVGIGTDSCSVMASGTKGAVQELMKKAIHAKRCPCNNHVLNNSLARSSKIVSCRNTSGTMRKVVAFANASAKRHDIFKIELGVAMQGICETRWVERHDGHIQFQGDNLVKICSALEKVSAWQDNKTANDAHCLLQTLRSSDFIISSICLTQISLLSYI
ncbi:52 kDa repressor of the inhibitor of the protein kinase [Eumeta japonica]|uniref:52 kDa repressor of the inhibitor of the protein kinase n=1 Tax=Eumeta variegata TaxID=151549 RepID=A0A4C1UCM7_EUMVA|nr:52 kDa repressor of the inhibitor of the protein kinase [Eumeta japonica]